MHQVVKDNGVELIPEPKPTNYWMRNKKPALDFLQDTPFAAERQLEDQRYLSELNRNPRLNDFTKMDKLRSVQIAQTKGQSRSVAIKANVINKVVREASGVHNYTIVPPPRMDDSKTIMSVKEVLEPETNPLVRAYAQESKSKPIVCSFGHRPKSASRTFHPATMKFRLKHGQILPSVKDGKTGVGLPVAVLKKVLHAPKIHHNFAEVIDDEQNVFSSHPSSSQSKRMEHNASAPGLLESQKQQSNSKLMNDLFLSKDEQDDLFAPNYNGTKRHSGRLAPLDAESKGSWISSIEQKQKQRKELQQKSPDRPDWNEGFHRITVKTKDRLALKKSLLNPKSDKPLSELLHRFDSLTIAENQSSIFCPEKQELDKVALSGQVLAVPKSVPLKGRPLYTDPWDIQVQQIKTLRKLDEEEKQERQQAKAFRDKLRTIPKVSYFPTTILKNMHDKQQLQNTHNPAMEKFETLDEDEGEEGDMGLESNEGEGLESTLSKTAATEYSQTKTGNMTNKSPTKHNSMSKRSKATANNGKSNMEVLAEKYPHWQQTEDEMHLALTLAKRGDRRALYDFHLAGGSSTNNRAIPTAWRTDEPSMTGSGLSDLGGGDWNNHTSHSAMSGLSDSQAMVDSQDHINMQQDANTSKIFDEESTQVHRAPMQYYAELGEEDYENDQEYKNQQLLDDNTIE